MIGMSIYQNNMRKTTCNHCNKECGGEIMVTTPEPHPDYLICEPKEDLHFCNWLCLDNWIVNNVSLANYI